MAFITHLRWLVGIYYANPTPSTWRLRQHTPPDYMNVQSRRPHERSHISFSTPLCWQLTVTALRSGVHARLPAPRHIGNFFTPLTPQAHHLWVRRLQSTTAFSVRSTAVNYTACSWQWTTLAFCPRGVFPRFVNWKLTATALLHSWWVYCWLHAVR
jgi:hypothetical protein